MHAHRLAATVLAWTLIAVAGCATERGGTYAQCLEGATAVREALARAPDPVTLDGTPLSGCFADDIDAADLSDVGASFVAVATDLARRARRQPNGAAVVQLGYLVGAMRNAEDDTQGITSELQRRVEQELHDVDASSPAFRRGERAGRRSG